MLTNFSVSNILKNYKKLKIALFMRKMIKKRLKKLIKTYFLVKNNISIKKNIKTLIVIFLFVPNIMLTQSIDILFIGNSYTYADNMPQMISNIALSFGDTLNFQTSTFGGATFNSHSSNVSTIDKISQKNWDYLVLQAQSQEPSFSPAQVANDVYSYAQILIDSITSNSICTEPIFFMTLGRKYGDQQNCQFYPPVCTYLGMQNRLRESYLSMSFTSNATCAPVGIS